MEEVHGYINIRADTRPRTSGGLAQKRELGRRRNR